MLSTNLQELVRKARITATEEEINVLVTTKAGAKLAAKIQQDGNQHAQRTEMRLLARNWHHHHVRPLPLTSTSNDVHHQEQQDQQEQQHYHHWRHLKGGGGGGGGGSGGGGSGGGGGGGSGGSGATTATTAHFPIHPEVRIPGKLKRHSKKKKTSRQHVVIIDTLGNSSSSSSDGHGSGDGDAPVLRDGWRVDDPLTESLQRARSTGKENTILSHYYYYIYPCCPFCCCKCCCT